MYIFANNRDRNRRGRVIRDIYAKVLHGAQRQDSEMFYATCDAGAGGACFVIRYSREETARGLTQCLSQARVGRSRADLGTSEEHTPVRVARRFRSFLAC